MAIGDVTFYPNSIHSVGVDYSAEPTISGQGFACSGAETTGEIYDLLDNKRTSVVTVDTNGETDDFTIRLDLTSNITGLNFFIIDNHNLNTAGAAVKFQESTPTDLALTSAYSGSLGSTLSASSIGGGDTVISPTDGVMVVNVTTPDTDSTFYAVVSDVGTFTADVLLGELCCGVKKTISIAPDINIISNDTQYGVTVNRALGGQKSSFKTMNSRKSWSLSWQSFFEADKTALEAVWAVTQGPRFPFYIDLGEAATPKLYYVRFIQDSLQIRQLANGIYTATLQIESEV